VREHDASAVDVPRAGSDLAVRDVDGHVRLEGRALAEEQVGTPRLCDEVVRPRRIARIDDRAPVGLEAVTEAAELAHVRHGEGQHAHVGDGVRRAGRERVVADREVHGLVGRLLVERLEQALRALGSTGRAVDAERA